MASFGWFAPGVWLRRWQGRRFRPGAVAAGRYRIVERLGEGSFGVAYLCIDLRSGQRCVLKRISPARGGKERAERIYAREIGIMSRLDHPLIPRLLDSFRAERQPCFVMEYAAGRSLEQLLFTDGRRFSEERSLELILRLLAAIEYLHGLRIVHRDISIANVLLHGDELRLIDFGLARELRAGDAHAHGQGLPVSPAGGAARDAATGQVDAAGEHAGSPAAGQVDAAGEHAGSPAAGQVDAAGEHAGNAAAGQVDAAGEHAGSPAAKYVTDTDGVAGDAPTGKRLRRRLHVTSDFYALGHLLLFLLYSTYPDEEPAGRGRREEEKSWEEELTLHPGTKKLLRRLLEAEQPYSRCRDIADEIARILPDLKQQPHRSRRG